MLIFEAPYELPTNGLAVFFETFAARAANKR